tara:strand:- start:1576 stop:2475 length:900 start_codon:yes stop_codon:yes gene_type:complete
MEILYGIENNYIDVTNICKKYLKINNIIRIYSGDCTRAIFFGDPANGILKHIIVKIKNKTHKFNDSVVIDINLKSREVKSFNVDVRLNELQSNLKINYGSFLQEFPEQKMAVEFLTGKEKVLEIGGNIGRNSLIIASILENKKNLLTLESNPHIGNQLNENKNINNLNFNVEVSALSSSKLIQSIIGWETKISNTLPHGFCWVNTISYNELLNKYNINFDTLVLDCEGAFYYILKDFPNILDNIRLIIVENDYADISQKNYVDNILISKKFRKIHCEALPNGRLMGFECTDFFYEVWKK